MKHLNKYFRVLLILVSATTLLLVGTLHAFSEYNSTTFRNHAISGYDTVAYFTKNKPVAGSAKYKYKWKDAVWLFSSSSHLAMFKNNPEKYAPQYGGYCAWAIAAKNKLYDIEPDVWKIVDGKLYLNYSVKIGKRWSKDIPGFIKQADVNWKKRLSEEKINN